jgi:HK97 family phage major capsid protein
MPVTDSSFDGVLVPQQISASILNLLVDGAPFAASLTRTPTNTRAVTWPVASPTGWAWLPELGPFPEIGVGDESVMVTVCKIGGVVKISNEAIRDSLFNISTSLATVLSDSMSRDLDLGLLEGAGDPEPDGVIPNAPEVTGPDLLGAVSIAMGEIGDAGGLANTLAIGGAQLAAENSKVGANGMFYPAGFAAVVGLKPVVVPALETALVYDSTRCYFVLNGPDSDVALSNDIYFAEDAAGLRIKARCAVGIPAPAKSIRKLTITAAP